MNIRKPTGTAAVAVTQPERFITLAAVVAHVQAVKACSEAEAREEVVRQISLGNLWHMVWANDDGKPYRETEGNALGRGRIAMGTPPRVHQGWKNLKIDWSASSVLDVFTEDADPKYRVLLIDGHLVASIWPTAAEAAANQERIEKAMQRHFLAPSWPLRHVLSWIRWRDPLKLDKAWRSSIYNHKEVNNGPNPCAELLMKLIGSQIAAFNIDGAISSDKWVSKSERKLDREDIYFRQSDVVATWPPRELISWATTEKATVPPTQTGLPGRPSMSWELIELQFRSRYQGGERHDTLTEWVDVLLTWLPDAHPGAPVPRSKTLQNKLRPILREVKGIDS